MRTLFRVAIALMAGLLATSSPPKSNLGRPMMALPEMQSRPVLHAVRTGDAWHMLNRELTATFEPARAVVRESDVAWNLTLRAYGRGPRLLPAAPVTPDAAANRVEYRRES